MLLLSLLPGADAHRPGLSYAQIDHDQLRLTFAAPELLAIAPLDDLDAARVLLAEGTILRTEIRVDGQPCVYGEPTVAAAAPMEGEEIAAGAGAGSAADGVTLTVSLDCPAGAQTYRADFWGRMEPGHRHYVEVGGEPVAVLDLAHPEASYEGAPGSAEVAGEFFGLGVEHIWTGYDHLLFLAGLLLAARGLRDMLLIVTGFTVAHSITLSLAALGYVTLPPEIVEPAIAASIVLVGVENFFDPPARRRVALTFVLGLIHGFGFAGMLAELGLPQGNLALALICFNGGVEVGQAVVAALLLPLLLWARRWEAWTRFGARIGSAGVALAGAWWLWERSVTLLS